MTYKERYNNMNPLIIPFLGEVQSLYAESFENTEFDTPIMFTDMEITHKDYYNITTPCNIEFNEGDDNLILFPANNVKKIVTQLLGDNLSKEYKNYITKGFIIKK